MDWLDYDTENCSIRRTLEVVGEKWSLLLLREAFNGVRRFDQIRDHTGISDAVLADRLRKLVAAGVLEVGTYRDPGSRARREYRLTEAGLDLYPVLLSLRRWGDRHRVDPEGPSVVVTHRDCGAAIDAVVECADGHRITAPREGRVAPGPAARRLDAG